MISLMPLPRRISAVFCALATVDPERPSSAILATSTPLATNHFFMAAASVTPFFGAPPATTIGAPVVVSACALPAVTRRTSSGAIFPLPLSP